QATELSTDSRDAVWDLGISASLLGRGMLQLGDVDRGLDALLAPVKAPVNIGPLLGQVTRDAVPRANHRGVALVLEADADPSPEPLDRDLVRRAVETLVDNALKHAPPGSVITLGARSRPGSTRIEVHDEGPSIPPPELARIFDRGAIFDATSAGGSAPRALPRLAALFCLVVSEAHGGRAWAERPPAGGVTFLPPPP